VADVETLTTEQLADLLRGQDAVVWSAGAGGGNPARTYAVDRDAAIRSTEATQGAGVPRYVMVSYLNARTGHVVPEDDITRADVAAVVAAVLAADTTTGRTIGFRNGSTPSVEALHR
jgi:uncharacterized protein YbjT (DUF2867 family)